MRGCPGVSAAGGRTLGRGGRVGLAGRDGRAAAAPRPFLERRPTRLRIHRGRAEPSPGPVRTRPKRRAAASASGPPLGTRYRGSAVPHWNVRAAVTPETPLRTGPVGRRGRSAAPGGRTERASINEQPPHLGQPQRRPPAAVGLDGREGPRRARAAAAPEGRPARASGLQ